MVQPSATARRAKYQRCHTLAAIPSHPIPEVGEYVEHDASGSASSGVRDTTTKYEFSSKLIPTVGESPSVSRGPSPERKAEKEEEEEYQVLEAITKPVSPNPGCSPTGSNTGSGSLSASGSGKGKKTRFKDKMLTINTDVNHSGQDDHHQHRPMKTLRSPTSPSVLINRVKDKIRQKVFQSSEWSAAIMHDERQRANTALLNSRRDIRLEQIQLHELHKKKGRNKTEPTPVKYDMGVVQPEVSQKGETVRAAFIRRRSISEDTYDRKPCMPKIEEVPQIEPRLLSSIPKPAPTQRRVPRFLGRNMRTQSLDSGKMARALVEAHLGMVGFDSSTSSINSNRTMESNSSMDTSQLLSATRIDHDASGGSARSSLSNTEVILDLKSKETMLGGSNNSMAERERSSSGAITPFASSSNSMSGMNQRKADPLDVQFDEHGQTWDVYGADFDPEVLGNSIQQHLEKLMVTGDGDLDQDRRLSQKSCQQEARSSIKDLMDDQDNQTQGFWIRLFCLFARRREMAN